MYSLLNSIKGWSFSEFLFISIKGCSCFGFLFISFCISSIISFIIVFKLLYIFDDESIILKCSFNFSNLFFISE